LQDANHDSHDVVQNVTSPEICRESRNVLFMERGAGILTRDYSELNGTKIRVENIHYELSREDLAVRWLVYAAIERILTGPGIV
jgi:hypothetical protein